jgi:hypothetical protein
MRRLQSVFALLGALTMLLLAQPAQAHKSSDAYLQMEADPQRLTVRWDIALRDLDVALDLDADGDGQLSWGEIRSSLPRIEQYVLPRLAVHDCDLRLINTGLERRNDGAYLVLYLAANCVLAPSPVIGYTLFADIDATHRGIAKIVRLGQAPQLLMLDPGLSALATVTVTATTVAPATRPRWQFIREGIRHILTGYDHVLFLLCLLIPAVMRCTPAGLQPLHALREALIPVLGIVSAFTVAHSITLGLAASKLVVLSPALIEPAIALTIMLAALDNIRPIFPVRRLFVAFFFGLIHGFGFADVLAELQLPVREFVAALLQFNVGLELGQLLIVSAAIALLFGIRRWRWYGAVVVRAGSCTAFGIAALWFTGRLANVALLPF